MHSAVNNWPNALCSHSRHSFLVRLLGSRENCPLATKKYTYNSDIIEHSFSTDVTNALFQLSVLALHYAYKHFHNISTLFLNVHLYRISFD
jgi:hypothetical protein